MAESFLCADAVLETLQNVTEGLVVNHKIIEVNLNNELPFNSTENILMAMVTNHAADRQECHEELRKLSLEAGHVMKTEGKPNDLIERIKKNPYFAPVLPEIDRLVDPKRCVGRAPQQVDEFLAEEVKPMLLKFEGQLDAKAVLNV